LIEGAPDERRRFMDFGVFHVEQSFLTHWRSYRRALRQRNAALRNGADASQVSSWNKGLSEAGEGMTSARSQFVTRLAGEFSLILSKLSPDLPTVKLDLARGWPAELDLGAALTAGLDRDFALGHTRQGPHRADLKISSDGLAVAGRLSRGQQKLVALALSLSLMKVVDDQAGLKPVFCFDDFASELDHSHQQLVLETVCGMGCQILLTGNQEPDFSESLSVEKKMFHVEQGRVSEVL
jgi:DNA replication and repair protein RecF